MTKTDTFDLEYANNGAWQVTFFEADGRTLLRDTNGNTKVDTGTLTPSASKTIMVRVKAPKTEPALSVKDIEITATSAEPGNGVQRRPCGRRYRLILQTAFYNNPHEVDLIWKNNDIVQLLVDATMVGLAFNGKPDKDMYARDNA
jgi:hypothetical protein